MKIKVGTYGRVVRKGLDADRIGEVVRHDGDGEDVYLKWSEVEGDWQAFAEEEVVAATRADFDAYRALQRQEDEAEFPGGVAGSAPETRGRVVVFWFSGFAKTDTVRVIAVPGDWDEDDVNRFVQAESERWDAAAVVNVEAVPAEYL